MKATVKPTFYKVASLQLALTVVYVIVSILQVPTIPDILSPLCYGFAGGVAFYAFAHADQTKPLRFIWLMYAATAFIWMIGEISWALIEAQGVDPSQDLLASICYLGTNVLLFAAVVVYAINQFRKWNGLQLLLDALAVTACTSLLVWGVILNRDSTLLDRMLAENPFSAISIFLDLLILSGILIWMFSARTGTLPGYMRMTTAGILLFVITDIWYFYADYHGYYSPDSVTDFLYLLSFQGFTAGSLLKRYSSNSEFVHPISNVGLRHRTLFLLIFPVADILLSRFYITEIALFAIIITVYQGASNFVQRSLHNEELLRKQMEANQELEKMLSEKDSELALSNELDNLTKLPNRRYFLNVLEKMIIGRQSNHSLALLFLNVDRFKTINDIYGFDMGDSLLIELAGRLKRRVADAVVLARHGGGEFALLFNGEFSQLQIESQIKRLLTLCNEPFKVGEQVIHLTTSVGAAFCPQDSDDAITLMKYADVALYRAKTMGYNHYCLYDPFLSQSLERKHEIEILLREADIEKDFQLFFQPQFSVGSNRLIGSEALIRWTDKGQGFIPPGEFIPIAEETGLIVRLGEWVMREAFRQTVDWNRRYGLNLKIGFNISPIQLIDVNFVETLKRIIEETGVETNWLDAEITENVMLSNDEEINRIFSLFYSQSISVSVDDFGTGYSTLNYLKKFSFDRIKIDKSLIDNIAINPSDLEIVKTILNMASIMGIKTIAEGVESRSQLAVLEKLGCDQVQGYLLGRPAPSEVFEEKYIKISLAVPAEEAL